MAARSGINREAAATRIIPAKRVDRLFIGIFKFLFSLDSSWAIGADAVKPFVGWRICVR